MFHDVYMFYDVYSDFKQKNLHLINFIFSTKMTIVKIFFIFINI